MHFCFEATIPAQRETVFAFHNCPRRLELLHQGRPRVRLLACEPQVRTGGETWVEISFTALTPITLGFRHTHFQPPSRFGEQLIHGPFSCFVHNHEFEAIAGGTLVRDLIEVRLPWHYGGDCVVRKTIAPCLSRVFQERASVLKDLALGGLLPRLPGGEELNGN